MKKIKINKEKFLEIRNNSSLRSSSELLHHIEKHLKSKGGLSVKEVDDKLCDVKTLQRMEIEGKATEKTLDLVCGALDIDKKILLEDKEDKNENIADYFDYNPKIDNANLQNIKVDDIKKFTSSANKRLYVGYYSKNTSEKSKSKVEEIIKLIDKYSKLTDPFSVVSSQNFNEEDNSHLKNRSNLRKEINRLMEESSLYLYATKVKYYSFWPFPYYEYDEYIKNIKRTPFYNDIYYPKKKIIFVPGETEYPDEYNFDPEDEDYSYKIIPIKLHYAIFIFSDSPDIGSISFNSEAGYRISNDIARFHGADIVSDDEDETLLGVEIRGNYKNALDFVETNEQFPENYLDSNNIKLIFKENYFDNRKKEFNIKDYSKEDLELADKILSKKEFFKVWDYYNVIDKEEGTELKEDDKENLNYFTRMEYLDNADLKKEFFNNIQYLNKYGSYIGLNKNNIEEKIFKSGFRSLLDSLDYTIEQAQMDGAYEDGYYDSYSHHRIEDPNKEDDFDANFEEDEDVKF